MKKNAILLIILMILNLFTALVRTGGPYSPQIICNVNISGTAENTAYVELFVLKSDITENYVQVNEAQCNENSISKTAEVVINEYDGFVSYTYHHKKSESSSKAQGEFVDTSTADDSFIVTFLNIPDEHRDGYKKYKFAYVDSEGKVLKITDEISKIPFFETIDISLTDTQAKVNYSVKSIFMFFLNLIIIIQAVHVIIQLVKYLTEKNKT